MRISTNKDECRQARWKALYVFGDSYSDCGAGYVDCNGPTAVAYLALRLGIPFTHAADPARAGKSLNFAVSGAQTGWSEGTLIGNCRLGFGMRNQVADFINRANCGEVAFDSQSTLFFFAGGINDRDLSNEDTVSNIEGEIRDIYARGGRHFVVALIPTISSCGETGARLNSALLEIPGKLRLPGAEVRISRWGLFFDEIMQRPSEYGLENVSNACAGRALFGEDPTPRGDPDRYYYYHLGHPSTAVHRIVGESLLREAVEAGGKKLEEVTQALKSAGTVKGRYARD